MSKIGVVITNIGTPEGPNSKGLRAYLKQFLMDPLVLQFPFIFRFLLVYLVIAPLRSSRSAKNYKKIWTPEGSPLLVETNKMVSALQNKLGSDYKVVVAMRYGKPSFSDAYKKLQDCKKIILFSQYPQYAESTTLSGLIEFNKYFKETQNWIIEPYFAKPWFIESYVGFLKDKLKVDSHLLMSFHGLPEAHIKKIVPEHSNCLKNINCCENPPDEVLKHCYRAQCFKSASLIAQGLNIKKDQYTVSFQSRVGKQKWISPSTEQTYDQLINSGKSKIQVICPGFSVDGLETLEEIAQSGKEHFLAQGGESFEFVPCLNDNPIWIEACAKMLKNIIS
jgi:protoporphyrin/coproporphyrin ferrochelatase